MRGKNRGVFLWKSSFTQGCLPWPFFSEHHILASVSTRQHLSLAHIICLVMISILATKNTCDIMWSPKDHQKIHMFQNWKKHVGNKQRSRKMCKTAQIMTLQPNPGLCWPNSICLWGSSEGAQDFIGFLSNPKNWWLELDEFFTHPCLSPKIHFISF